MSPSADPETSTRTTIPGDLVARGLLVLGLLVAGVSGSLHWQVQQQHSAVARRVSWVVALQQPSESAAIYDRIVADPWTEAPLRQTIQAARDTPAQSASVVVSLQQETDKLTRELSGLWQLSTWSSLLSALLVVAAGAGAVWTQSLRTRLAKVSRNHRQATDRADKKAQLLSALFAQDLFGIHIFDGQGRPLYSAPNITRRRGLQAPDFFADQVADIRTHPIVETMGAVEAIDRALSGESVDLPARPMHFAPASGHNGPGQTLWLAGLFIPLRNRHNEVERMIIIIRDETDKRELFERVQRAEHLAEVGSLAQGVTHEINNPLTFVSMNLSMIEEMLDEPDLAIDDMRHLLADMNQGVNRIRIVTSELSELAAPHIHRRGPVALNDLLEEVIHRVQSTGQDPSVQITTQLKALSPVSGTVERLELVFINLLENAMSACQDTEDGVIEVITGEDDDRFAWVEVRDNGSGISPDIIDRVFAPFFTTQQGGRGLGLGLYLVRCYLEELGGRIDAKSPPGEGTCMRVILPMMAEELTSELSDSDRAKIKLKQAVEAVAAAVATGPAREP